MNTPNSNDSAHASENTSNPPIDPQTVQYIKLGASNAWAENALLQGEVQLTEHPVPANLASSQDFEAMRSHLLQQGHAANKASDITREVRDFLH